MLEMLDYDFMQRAFIAGIIIAILASISGSFIVLRRYSMMTETLAHSALVGVAVDCWLAAIRSGWRLSSLC